MINSILGLRPALQNPNQNQTAMKTTCATDSKVSFNPEPSILSGDHATLPDIAATVAASLASIPDEACRSSRNINEMILHCSATKEGRDFCAADIRRWHLQRGFNDIGYHFVIKLDGTVERGRDINLAGAHCLHHNRRSIGICYIGGLDRAGRPADTRTPAQRLALPALIRRLRRHHPQATIHGHREFAPKACPCFNAAEYASLPPED